MKLFEVRMREVSFQVHSANNFRGRKHLDTPEIKMAFECAIRVKEENPDDTVYIWVFDKETGIAVYDILIKSKL